MSAKYLSIIGSRPQYIKVLDNLKNHVIVDTGQHYDYDMSDIFMKQLNIKPKYMLGKTELGAMIKGISQIIDKERPDVVIVYGDTRSTLAGALSAKFKAKMLAHVESGMRSGDITQPEELNRIIVDRISDFKFCTDDTARRNLNKEGNGDNVYVVGDVMWDNLKKVMPIKMRKDYRKFNLLTIHRAQNTDNPQALKNILEACGEWAEPFIFPVHPRTLKVIKKSKIKIPKNVQVLPPQGYKEMTILEGNARKILTDSGGVQREAYWFTCPVIILRTETEWGDIINEGWGTLVGSDKTRILEALQNHNPNAAKNRKLCMPEYGAKATIAQILK